MYYYYTLIFKLTKYILTVMSLLVYVYGLETKLIVYYIIGILIAGSE